MPLDPVLSAILFAAAVTIHNLEEFVWLPSFADPRLPRLVRSAFGFRVAVTAITLAFWTAVAALASGMPARPIIAGFAAAMVVNAVVPHVVLTMFLRRYHPGTATALLLVVPSAIVCLQAIGAVEAMQDAAFASVTLAAFLGLGLSVPLLMTAGRWLEKR